MIYLRQSTASQEIPLGYFVDSTDGNTEETALTINNTDIKIWKTGATTLANKNSGGGTHISNGIYYATLDDTDTNTIGPMVIFVHITGALTVRLECCVLDEAVYDVTFGTTAPATATNITGGTITTVTNLTNAPTSGDLTATMKTSVTTACTASTPTAAAVTGAVGSVTAGVTVTTNNDKTGYGLSAAAVQAVWDALTAALTTVNSIGKLLVDNINATISSRSTVTTAQVNAEVVDALATDTYAEPGQGAPAATATLAVKIGYLYKAWRNRNTQTATQYSLYNDDAVTVDHKATFSDDGTTADRGEIATGP